MIANLCRAIFTAQDLLTILGVGMGRQSLAFLVLLLIAALTGSGCAPVARADAQQHFAAAAWAAAPAPIPNQPPPTSVLQPARAITAAPRMATVEPVTDIDRTPLRQNSQLAPPWSEQTTPAAPPAPSPTEPLMASQAISTVIGYSTGNLPIIAYNFGNGPDRVALVGGIHGGSEWNSVLLAYAVIDHLTANPTAIPAALTVHVIPVANPDGLQMVTGKTGRFTAEDVQAPVGRGRVNGNGVDLNRNWDCDWAATAWWGNSEVSGGSAPFSEIETHALRNFFIKRPAIQAAIFWHSAVPGVFAGGCDDIYPAAEALAEIYATAADYPYGDAFTHYPITGDVTNWLSRQQIPAITVELASRSEIEWAQNWAGTAASLAHLGQRTTPQLSYPTPTLPLSP